MLVFVKELITHSLADANYQRVCEMLGVVRSEMVEYDFPDFYNDTIRDLKEAIVKGELDGDRMDMWEEIRKNSLGLIVSEESDSSKVTKEEVNNVSHYPNPCGTGNADGAAVFVSYCAVKSCRCTLGNLFSFFLFFGF